MLAPTHFSSFFDFIFSIPILFLFLWSYLFYPVFICFFPRHFHHFSILGMNLFGGKFCTKAGGEVCTCEEQRNSTFKNICICDRRNFDTLLWAIVTVFQVSHRIALTIPQSNPLSYLNNYCLYMIHNLPLKNLNCFIEIKFSCSFIITMTCLYLRCTRYWCDRSCEQSCDENGMNAWKPKSANISRNSCKTSN